MAEVTQTRILPPEFIEAAGKVALGDLATATGQFKTADLSKVFGPQFIAGQDPLQAQAQKLATQGIGAYQPFLTTAGTAQTEAGKLASQAGQFVGPQAYQQFMSPYQQDVIKETLREFDVQAQKGLPALAAQAINAGAFGGGREGVQRAEYQSTSDRNRAALQAQLLQQGFGQAQSAAAQAFGQQQALANQQLGLGQAALGLGQSQQAFLGQDVGALSTLGAQNQALRQAQLQGQQQLAQQQLQQPLTAAQTYGQGVTSLIAGYPGQTTQITAPSPSPIATAIGAGGTLAGIYRAFNRPTTS
jgi:hypothetical protein|tara:strand:+ start:291 stop:1196 length:906 start_codon:yes stop_codon:yes gene_type:complete